MSGFSSVMSWVVMMMQYPFKIYGFSVSFWNIFIWSIVASIIAVLVGRLLHG